MSEANLFRRAGGMQGLRRIVTDFYDRVFSDVMIGFFFRRADKERLIEKEVELMAEAFGASGVTYTGRNLEAAHRTHRIMGGQFDRRLQILKETLRDHDVPDDVRKAWIQHTVTHRSEVTRDSEGECTP